MKTRWMLVVALAGCLDKDADERDGAAPPAAEDSADADTDMDADTDTDEWCDTDTDTGGGHPLFADVVYFEFQFTLQAGALGAYTLDGEQHAGSVDIWFVDPDAWEGTEDEHSGCVITLALTPETGAAAPTTEGLYFGWEPDLDASLLRVSDSCAWVEPHPLDVVAAHEWTFGAGPMSEELRGALRDAFGDDLAPYEQSLFGGVVGIDGQVQEMSYGIAFATTADGELVVDEDGGRVPVDLAEAVEGGDGHFRASAAYGIYAHAL